MIIGIPREITPGENRVAATPDTVQRLGKLGYEVRIEAGAGVAARFYDDDYEKAGASIVDDAAMLWSESDIVIKIHPPIELPDTDGHELDHLKEQAVLISLIEPAKNDALLERLEAKEATVFGLDCVPRLSRAQSVDVLSSMAAIAGYRAVIEAAARLDRFLSPQMTAAGSTPPAEVMVIGAGVAGLSAIATAKGLGAQVKAFDVRPAVKEEVESLGGRFLELEFDEEGAEGEGGYANIMSDEFIEAEMAMFREEIPASDVVITTASIPGKPAPKLILEDMVESMNAGSVIVDLAAASGGNCELTEVGEIIERNGVAILGETNLASHLPSHASEYFGRNIANLVRMLGDAAHFDVDEDDAVVRGMLVMLDGELKWPPPSIEPSPARPPEDTLSEADKSRDQLEERREEVEHNRGLVTTVAVIVAAALMGVVGVYAPADFVQHFTVFVLACFVGWQVVWNVTPSLHTPLMSVTNAISGIIIVGGILQVTTGATQVVLWLSAGAILVAGINIFGGFLVTQRMLKMFRAEAEGE
ncbi:MAG: Re/Si-specific NAD(P)(+) transhydrogenase subunit alpha [Myxococcota bacterium]